MFAVNSKSSGRYFYALIVDISVLGITFVFYFNPIIICSKQ